SKTAKLQRVFAATHECPQKETCLTIREQHFFQNSSSNLSFKLTHYLPRAYARIQIEFHICVDRD
ncbi:MAG: hypothetical protein J4O05_10940, partial [Chloroflexi bacterium]|nr:hypothetical protein [Chloroflexota bacterium]